MAVGKYFNHGDHYEGELDATNLKERIRKIGIPTSWYADKIGVSRSSLYNGLSEKVKLNDDTIFEVGWLICSIEGAIASR